MERVRDHRNTSFAITAAQLEFIWCSTPAEMEYLEALIINMERPRYNTVIPDLNRWAPGGRVTLIRSPRKATQRPQEGTRTAAMRVYWDAQIAQGVIPSGADLNRAAGVPHTSSLGRQRARVWVQELPAEAATA